VEPEYGIVLLNRLIADARELTKKPNLDGSDIQAWNDLAREHMTKALGSGSASLNSVLHTGGGVGFWMDMTEADRQAEFQGQLQNKIKLLGSAIRTLETEIELANRRKPQAQGAREGNQAGPLQRVEHLIDRFHAVAGQLRVRHGNRSTLDVADEYDVQDLLHALLRIEYSDVRAEEYTPTYGGSASRVDFLLKREQVMVEVKHTRAGLADREVGEQLLIDIGKYRSHPDCKALVCFVYDPEHLIRNAVALEDDLSGSKHGLSTRVFVRPKP